MGDDKGKEIVSTFEKFSHRRNYIPVPELKSLSGLFDMTNNLSHINELKTLFTLIDLAIKRNYLDFLNIIYFAKYKLLFEK